MDGSEVVREDEGQLACNLKRVKLRERDGGREGGREGERERGGGEGGRERERENDSICVHKLIS